MFFLDFVKVNTNYVFRRKCATHKDSMQGQRYFKGYQNH